MRYFACWVYFSSLLWKMINGSFWQPDFGIESLKENVAYILYEDPAGKLAFLYRFFLEHPLLTNTGAKLIFLLEGFFIVGFFTKKWDKVLFVLIFLIHGLLCFFADVVFIELCVLAFLFIPAAGWARLQTWVSSLKRGSSA
ncbi:hypothetical protein [Niabella ginsenosidivorans]|nr:hypothetical protein [Niabella ginsenosidivorans]